MHQSVARSSPEFVSVAAKDGDLAVDEPDHPSTRNSASKLTHVTAVDLHHFRDLPSPLGEIPIIAVSPARRRRPF
jgi:hypothetical protein